uniref:CCT domain-containing protein n=1 Tax=Araucaria cunninghamii TaxID=56994 RepID=A0A0D6R6B4_ARACU
MDTGLVLNKSSNEFVTSMGKSGEICVHVSIAEEEFPTVRLSSHFSTGVVNTVEVLDAKDVSISQSLPSPSASKRTSNCIHNPMSGAEENGGSGVSYSPIPPHLQNLPKMQRSLSSHELGQTTASPRINETLQYPHSSPMSYTRMKGTLTPQFLDFQGLSLRPSFMPMRRVYSTGDIKSAQGSQRPMEASSSISEDGEFRIGQYTVEERKECLHRYRKKRNKRNFNKKIKYACRKSLADNQPRVRGRFVPKTQEAGGTSAKTNAHLEEDDEEVVCTY